MPTLWHIHTCPLYLSIYPHYQHRYRAIHASGDTTLHQNHEKISNLKRRILIGTLQVVLYYVCYKYRYLTLGYYNMPLSIRLQTNIFLFVSIFNRFNGFLVGGMFSFIFLLTKLSSCSSFGFSSTNIANMTIFLSFLWIFR